jgi:hypothetical protein
MSYTLDKASYDVTYVRRDGVLHGMVQPDTYTPESGRWTSWRRDPNVLNQDNWEFYRYLATRVGAAHEAVSRLGINPPKENP